MTFYVESETEKKLPFEERQAAILVLKEVLKQEGCLYETEINLLLTDKTGIREYNKQYRGIDKETDVLSFPNVDYEKPGDFSAVEAHRANYINPDTGELVLGDIILSIDRVYEQAKEYGHSVLREFSFLIAHSMLHLTGYDHERQEEAAEMERRQDTILNTLGITRDKEYEN